MEPQGRPDERSVANPLGLAPRREYHDDGAAGHDPAGRPAGLTVRDLLMVGLRRQRLIVASFLALTAAVALVAVLRPPHYQAEMKLLIERERADPVVTADPTAQQRSGSEVTEAELNSEVELLTSHDLLQQVVLAEGLQKNEGVGLGARVASLLGRRLKGTPQEQAIARAVRDLASRLDIEPLEKSNVIRVRYASEDPAKAADVLNTLADRYMDKHLAVHRPSGTFHFFQEEADRYGHMLVLAQARVTDSSRRQGIVSVGDERAIALRQMGELEDTEQATQTQIAEAGERIRVLQVQLASTPERTTTDVHSGSSQLLEQLQSDLLTHELHRIELLRAFQPTYPPVKEEEEKIAKIREMITAAEQSPLVERSTGRNPVYDSLVAELDKTRADFAGLQARATSVARGLASVHDRAERLEEVGLQQQTLVRSVTQAEQNYLIYAQKREEARISDALDAQRILNVAVVEKASAPFVPSGPGLIVLLLVGIVGAALASVMLALGTDRWLSSFSAPGEAHGLMDLPIAASGPRR